MSHQLFCSDLESTPGQRGSKAPASQSQEVQRASPGPTALAGSLPSEVHRGSTEYSREPCSPHHGGGPDPSCDPEALRSHVPSKVQMRSRGSMEL